jgi:hypothetical protein
LRLHFVEQPQVLDGDHRLAPLRHCIAICASLFPAWSGRISMSGMLPKKPDPIVTRLTVACAGI